jgi:short-subunit dehydrogenase
MADRPIALVTGASSGIGASFARRLAEKGHDLVVVARDVTRLEKLAADLPGVDVEVLSADLSEPDQLSAVEERLGATDRPVDKLINNAGYGTAGNFPELDVDREVGMIDLNIAALVRLSHAAAAAMVPRRRGGILNVGSVGSFQPSPYNAVYSATKAFVLSFSEALHEELKPHGVHVTCLCPGFTVTEFQERAGINEGSVPGMLRQDADTVAKIGVRALDHNVAVRVAGVPNKGAVLLERFLPRVMVRKMAAQVTKRF